MTTDIFHSCHLHARTQLIKATIVVAFVIGFLLSPQLWINRGRSFPMISPIEGMYVPPTSVNLLLISLFIGLSVLWIFYERRVIGFIAFSSLLLVIVQDQMRWQPWVYMYLLMLLPYLVKSNQNDKSRLILNSLQWIIAGVYVWSGIQKMNANFLDGTVAQMITGSGAGLDFQWRNAGYAIPIIEVSIGMALLAPKFRKIGMLMAIATHLVILFYLSPIVQDINSIVYPWNVAMIFFVVLLFWERKENSFHTIKKIPSNALMITPVILVWVFPVLNLFGYWDHYLSFSLYSNKPSNFFIAIEESQINKIDKKFKNYFADIPGLQGGQMIEINKWAFSELNVPFYPEMRSFRKLSANFCGLGIHEDKLVFLELSTSNGSSHYSRFTCRELKSR